MEWFAPNHSSEMACAASWGGPEAFRISSLNRARFLINDAGIALGNLYLLKLTPPRMARQWSGVLPQYPDEEQQGAIPSGSHPIPSEWEHVFSIWSRRHLIKHSLSLFLLFRSGNIVENTVSDEVDTPNVG